MGWTGNGLEDVPDYIAAYADGYIDALSDVEFMELEDRQSTEERDRARAACRQAVTMMVVKNILLVEGSDAEEA